MQLAVQVGFNNLAAAVFLSDNNENQPTQLKGAIAEGERKEDSNSPTLSYHDVFSYPGNSPGIQKKTPCPPAGEAGLSRCEHVKLAQLKKKKSDANPKRMRKL